MQIRSADTKKAETDVLVLGSGIAGLAAAMEARRQGSRVLVASQGPIGRPSVSYYAGGQLALHLPGGADGDLNQWFDRSPLTDAAVATAVVKEAEPVIRSLTEYDVLVRPSSEGGYSIGGTRHERGAEQLISTMARRASQSGIILTPNFTATRLLTDGERCRGAEGFSAEGEWVQVHSKATVVSIGGAGRLFQRSFGMTGDGYALLLEAGAHLINMEFIKFFPLGLPSVRYPPQRPGRSFYDLEGLRAVNAKGEDIYEKHLGQNIQETMQELYPRFVTASWIVDKENRDGPVYLDFTQVPPAKWDSLVELGPAGLTSRFSGSVGLWKQVIEKRMVPTRWISHSVTGGARVGPDMSTGVSGLFAGGELVDGFSDLEADPMYHVGPLAWALTTGHIAGREAGVAAAQTADGATGRASVEDDWIDRATQRTAGTDPARMIRQINAIMVKHGGPLRSAASMLKGIEALSSAEEKLEQVAAPTPAQLSQAMGARSMLFSARAILTAGLLREESRSEHYREDIPARDEAFATKAIDLALTDDGELEIRARMIAV